jgi:hypothetical protein
LIQLVSNLWPLHHRPTPCLKTKRSLLKNSRVHDYGLNKNIKNNLYYIAFSCLITGWTQEPTGNKTYLDSSQMQSMFRKNAN